MAGYVGLPGLVLLSELSSEIAPCVPAVQIKSNEFEARPIFLPLALSASSSSIVSGDASISVLSKHAICVSMSHGARA